MSNILNIILAFLIVISFVFYLYFKTKQIRTNLPIRKKWYTNRAGVALGIILILFGINQIILYHTVLTYVVCLIMIVFGLFACINYYKRVRHYGQYIAEEEELNKK
ncbi:YtpI family protein [Rummeliibacillus pycnus]|uniref:YtpI family protein n=1 Tax=Rummeliibacillus pycnus TaxID=101070 RepID=UPI000C9A7674|nr:YtpI family protein [Rummeliibacillus pycnus]